MKSVFVDGNSLSWMRRALGIGVFNFGELAALLRGLGKSAELERMTYVLNRASEKTFGKHLRTAGFEVIPVDEPGADDAVIYALINETKANEIIIVSNDQDFVSNLRIKKEGGARIVWVGTKAGNGSSTSISQSLIDLFEKGEFEFVDLADHAMQIMRRPWEDKTEPVREPPRKKLEFKLTLVAPADVIQKLLQSLIRIADGASTETKVSDV